MKKTLTKIVAAVLTLCMLPVPDASLLVHAAGNTQKGLNYSNQLPEDQGIFNEASPSDAAWNSNPLEDIDIEEDLFDESLIEEGLDAFDISKISLDEDELENGAKHGTESGQNISAYNSTVQSGPISSVYDKKSRRRMRKVIRGGTDLVRYIAEQLTFGVTPIRIDKRFSDKSPNVTAEDIWAAIQEASWQNQLIMEEDHFPYPTSYGGRISNMLRYSTAAGEVKYYTFEVNYTYPNIAQRKARQLALLDKAEEIIDTVGIYSGGTRVEEVYAINNYIIDHAYYDRSVYDGSRGISISNTDSRKAYGVLLNGKGVCTSYARAFQLVMTMAGFTCLVDGGDATIWSSTPSPHAWNLVYTRDNKYLMVDPTWNDDDNVIGVVRNSFLMIPYNNTFRSRKSDKSTFANKGEYAAASLSYSDLHGYDYMKYIQKSCKIADMDKLLLSYAKKGYLPDCIRYEGDMNMDKFQTELNQFAEKLPHTGDWITFISKIRGTWSQVTPNYVEFKLIDEWDRKLEITKFGNAEIVKDGSGNWITGEKKYTGKRGTKPAPEPETDDESLGEQPAKRKVLTPGGGSGGSGGSGGGGGAGGGGGTGGSGEQDYSHRNNSSGSWQQDSYGWWYQYEDGSYLANGWAKIDGFWYLFDYSGYALRGWQRSGGQWFYMNSDCIMSIGWVNDNGKWYYMNVDGAMLENAWIESNGQWYYLGSDGAMLTNTRTPDGYYVRGDGSLE